MFAVRLLPVAFRRDSPHRLFDEGALYGLPHLLLAWPCPQPGRRLLPQPPPQRPSAGQHPAMRRFHGHLLMAWSPTGPAQDAATLAPFSPVPRKNQREIAERRETLLAINIIIISHQHVELSFPHSFLLTPLELWLPLRAHLRARSNACALSTHGRAHQWRETPLHQMARNSPTSSSSIGARSNACAPSTHGRARDVSFVVHHQTMWQADDSGVEPIRRQGQIGYLPQGIPGRPADVACVRSAPRFGAPARRRARSFRTAKARASEGAFSPPCSVIIRVIIRVCHVRINIIVSDAVPPIPVIG